MGVYTQRNADWVIQKAFAEAKAKATMPPVGSTKYNLLLTLVDTEQKNWQDEPGVQWDSLYLNPKPTLAAPITTDNTYALPNSIREISQRQGDYVLVGNTPYRIVGPNELYTQRFEKVVAQIGRNLVFPAAFAAESSLIGATITVPAYGFVDDVDSGTDLIQCDNPLFIAYMAAASFARNDIVKLGQYNNILDKATNLMNKMKESNGGQFQTLQLEWAAEGETWV